MPVYTDAEDGRLDERVTACSEDFDKYLFAKRGVHNCKVCDQCSLNAP
jgi:hypothetical protein